MSTLLVAEIGAAQDRVAQPLARAQSLVAAGRSREATKLLRRTISRVGAEPRLVLALVPLLVPADATPALAEPSDAVRNATAEASRHISAAISRTETREARHSLELADAWAKGVGGDHRAAIEQTGATAGRLDPEAASVLARLGVLAVRRNDLIAADRALEIARRTHPQDLALISDHAAIRLARGRANDAVAMLSDMLTRNAGDEDAREDLAGAYLAAGRTQEAVDVYATLLHRCPATPECHLVLAQAAMEARDFRLAERAAREALRRSGASDARAAVVLGVTLLSQDRRRDAEAAFREALRREPGNVRAREALQGAAP